ncbi:MAG: crossover junction endodeoxyribonuclease RuvC [Candidatus Liptonbacteria bacterium]|nr:crossover junction endodeoxyribonuclease RuvC [Candidatus Liptonbacteria bacterium]
MGIDPGTRRIGYGLIKKTTGGSAQRIELVDAGILTVNSKNDIGALLEIKNGVSLLLKTYKPKILAIEKLYFSKNQKTALQVAECRGVVLTAAAEAGLEIEEYAPSEVKLGLTGYGSADKKAVLKMVRLILKSPALDVIDDASDALALAIVSADRSRIKSLADERPPTAKKAGD